MRSSPLMFLSIAMLGACAVGPDVVEDEDEYVDPGGGQTAARLGRAPSGGFAKGANCERT